ncbi:MAG: flavodoxin [Firmicutes bacterium]|jgi:flavodoxin|nr:flavodoxin [Bacillota bacterium]
MKAAVRYYTKTGNTKKICDAIAEAIGVEAKSVDVPLEEETEVLFLGNSVYAANIDKEVKDFVEANKDKIGCLVNVSSAALLEGTYGRMSKLCGELGVNIDQREFHCKGSFKFMHKGRPNQQDLDEAAAFAKEIMASK